MHGLTISGLYEKLSNVRLRRKTDHKVGYDLIRGLIPMVESQVLEFVWFSTFVTQTDIIQNMFRKIFPKM